MLAGYQVLKMRWWEREDLEVQNRRYAYQYHLMLIPVMIFLVIFHILPCFGIVIAFQKFIPAKGILGSEFVGLKYFEQMFRMSNSWRIFRNTIVIACWKIVMNMIVPIVFSILLNELRHEAYKRTVQTVVYLPHFMSWVVLAIPIMNIFAYDGIVNDIITALGGAPIMFLASNTWFRPILILTDVWKEFGFGTIVYLAAITGIDPALYEAAVIDGASRGQRMLHVTLPGMLPTIVLLATRSLGNVLNAGFEVQYLLGNGLIKSVSDTIDIYVLTWGISQNDFSLGTAAGIFKSVVSIALILVANFAAKRMGEERLF